MQAMNEDPEQRDVAAREIKHHKERALGDERTNLKHVLAPDTDVESPAPVQADTPSKTNTQNGEDVEDTPHHSAMETTYRRNANGSISSVYSGNKIPFLKKDDGQPLWRKDIQFLFLRTVFEDESRVFTKASDGTDGHTFADIYIDAMAKSNKCSQVLREKLLADRSQAAHMAMICLLVNVGRMNTTLNFFPEMRARVRTFHSIPCLQAHQGSQAYKQLKDGPRLKSILKGATEETNQPSTVEEIVNHAKPRTNPVNLIFALSQYAPKISETHFFPPRDFFDLFMRPTLSSKSRATAFLWLIWWYLESDYSEEHALSNPFGSGLKAEGESLSVKVPALVALSEEEADQENVDTEEELAYGEAKRLEREQIIIDDPLPPLPAPSRSKASTSDPNSHHRFRHSSLGSSNSDTNPSPPPRSVAGQRRPNGKRMYDDTDLDTYMSPSESGRVHMPSNTDGVRINALLNEESTPRASPKGARRANQIYDLEPISDSTSFQGQPHLPHLTPSHVHGVSPVRPLSSDIGASFNAYQDNQVSYYRPSSGHIGEPSVPTNTAIGQGSTSKRARPVVTLEQSRRERVRRLLYDQMQEIRTTRRRERKRRGVMVHSWINCRKLPQGWDSDEDELKRWGGIDELLPHDTADLDTEDEAEISAGDIGFHAKQISRSFKRIGRALDGTISITGNLKRTRDDNELAETSLRAGAIPGIASEDFSFSSNSRSIRAAPAIKEETTPAKRKRIYKPRPRATKVEDEKITVTPVSDSRRRGIKTLADDGVRTGEVGIPMDVFMADTEASAATVPASNNPRSRVSRIKDSGGSGTYGEDTAAEGDAEDEGLSRDDNTPTAARDDNTVSDLDERHAGQEQARGSTTTKAVTMDDAL